VIDDLHWADRASRELFGFLARAMTHGSVLLIGTYRDDELHRGHPLRQFLAELDRARRVERVDLERFDRAQTAAVPRFWNTRSGTNRGTIFGATV